MVISVLGPNVHCCIKVTKNFVYKCYEILKNSDHYEQFYNRDSSLAAESCKHQNKVFSQKEIPGTCEDQGSDGNTDRYSYHIGS